MVLGRELNSWVYLKLDGKDGLLDNREIKIAKRDKSTNIYINKV